MCRLVGSREAVALGCCGAGRTGSGVNVFESTTMATNMKATNIKIPHAACLINTSCSAALRRFDGDFRRSGLPFRSLQLSGASLADGVTDLGGKNFAGNPYEGGGVAKCGPSEEI